MKKNIRVLVANPAGNITIFVLDQFQHSHYQAAATQLLAMENLGGEQVAFVTGENTMNMCGMEFCGNASRAFALMVARQREITGYGKVNVNVSGCEETLTVEVNTDSNFTRIKMPPPLQIKTLDEGPLIKGSHLVDMGGIMHVVVKNLPATLENFNTIKDFINEKYNPPAMGVMFYDTINSTLTPVVYVKDVDTTYFEGSCGSGTTAVAAAFSVDETEGTFRFTLPQPAGTITSTVEKAHGNILSIYIEGSVSFSDIMEVQIDL